MMIERCIEVSARNPLWVFLSVIVASFAAYWALMATPIDAIPDLSETQVIIYSKWDRSPDIIEDQVTYPIITALLGAPKVKDIRGFSDFGYSYVYVIFEEGTDPYWARSRVLESLSKINQQLPEGVKTEMGPDATGIGWVFQYALIDPTHQHSSAELRSLQDWFLRFVLQTVPGVSEVASLGGFQKQYQIQVDPNALLIHKITIQKVAEAIRSANNDIGARVLEVAGAEYMIRGRGYIQKPADFEKIVLGYENGVPIELGHVAKVKVGPEMRRGIADWNGEGDAVGGIVIMRYGENATRVIDAVKAKIEEVKSALPKGVELRVAYDRSDLIRRAVQTLVHELKLEMWIVSLVILIFLLHIPSALIPIVTLPIAVLLSFLPFRALGLSSNIMSLGGIAIAIGAMVDAAIVVVENAHKHMEEWERGGKQGDVKTVIIRAIQEVGPASFYSLLVIAVAFLPIFALEAQEGKLFKPLAWTKNISMVVAAILSITLDPALRVSWSSFQVKDFRPRWLAKIRNAVLVGHHRAEEEHPISRFLFKHYSPWIDRVVDHRWWVMAISTFVMALTIPIYFRLGSEFMPPLNEGSILYMPTTLPGISVAAAQDLLRKQDQILKSFPEVESVLGKAGRAETSTDPAPFSMMETVVMLKPQNEWRRKPRWYTELLPSFLHWPWNVLQPDVVSWEELVREMNDRLQIPGSINAWTMPIRARIDMLTTGIRTPVGIKVLGNSMEEVERTAKELEVLLADVKGTRSVIAERISGGYYLDFHIERDKLARYGLSVKDVQDALMSAVGGESVGRTIEGRERYSINIRYPIDARSNLEVLERVLVSTPDGSQIPIGQVARLEMSAGPSMIRNENAWRAAYVYIDVADRDIGSYVRDAKARLNERFKASTGVTLQWSGQYENMQRVREKLVVILPLTLFLIVLLLYMNTKSWPKTGIILLAVPFSAIGAIWLLYLLGYNLSIAVWVGLIALLGVDAETGIFMLLYLDLAYEKAKREGKMKSWGDLKQAIHVGAVQRVRPKVMTVACLVTALLPIMWTSSMEAGADVMKRIAAPMLGGIITSFAMELLVYPAIFAIWKERELFRS